MANINKPAKRHHYVPEMILKRFIGSTGLLWVYNKHSPDRSPSEHIPKEVFYKNHANSRLNTDGTKDPTLEHDLALLEGKCSPIIDKICHSAQAGKEPNLSKEQKEILNIFTFTLYKRSPQSFTNSASDEDILREMDAILEDFEKKQRPLTTNEKLDFSRPETRKRLAQNARVGAISDIGIKVQNRLNSMGLAILTIRKPNKSFVIGSKPIIKLTPENETRLGKPGVEVWLPISPNVAISPMPQKGELLLNLTDDQWLRKLNKAIFDQSTVIGANSKKLLESLATPR